MPSVYVDTDEQIIVSYPIQEQQQRISKATYFAIRAIFISSKINAIKFIRMVHGTGLLESARIVETIIECPNVLASPFEKGLEEVGEYTDIRGITAETIN